jgi:hypothetical protein
MGRRMETFSFWDKCWWSSFSGDTRGEKKFWISFVFVIFLTGCATYYTQIISDPPGARVIVNGSYLGTTPTTISWTTPALNRAFSGHTLVEVLPTEPGHCTQRQPFFYGDHIPRTMFFDTRLCPQPPSIDVNVR